MSGNSSRMSPGILEMPAKWVRPKYISPALSAPITSQVGYNHTNGGSTRVRSSRLQTRVDGTTINPTFNGGLNLGAPKIPLPKDSSMPGAAPFWTVSRLRCLLAR